LSDNPMIDLNRAIAAAMADGPERGLALLEPLEQDKRLAGSHRLQAVRAHLLEMAGDIRGAIACYGRAASRTTRRC
jgi:predicted RNA polymerase sigma factor